MNGGMYKPDGSPLGLYIEQGKLMASLDTTNGVGNFYLKPNGVFFLTFNDSAGICASADFRNLTNVKFATQSGPLLLSNGKIHKDFKPESNNLNIRNGVGILPDNRIVFVMSKVGVNFYKFADYFKALGCQDALYLDGLVSRTYLPANNWKQTDGDFGVIIGVTEPR